MKDYYNRIWGLPEESQIIPPIPLSTFILKLSGRCNLNCTYCYVYHSVDHSWSDKPDFMGKTVIDQAILRIIEHTDFHSISFITLILHGGEPLLIGLETIEYILKRITELKNPQYRIDFILQTNGILIDENVISLFYKYKGAIGISIDGYKEANKHRIKKDGTYSFCEVDNKIKLINKTREGRNVFSGILSVINPLSDPIEVYKYLVTHHPKSIEFILPVANNDRLPEGKKTFQDTTYGDWLIKLFDYWFLLSTTKIRIKFFANIIQLLFKGESESEVLGHPSVNVITIDTDGSIEGVDTLKSSFDSAPSLNMSVFSSTFNEVLLHHSILSRMQGVNSLCHTCKECKLVDICGGGYLPHRYSVQNGFLNPSVYCHDISKLIWHIRQQIIKEIQEVKN